jgi:hypothetical protein
MLGDCHRRIERSLNVLVSVARQNGGWLDEGQRTALVTSLHYFRDAAPKHTADEEDSLFPSLRQTCDAEAIAFLYSYDFTTLRLVVYRGESGGTDRITTGLASRLVEYAGGWVLGF